MDASIHHCRLQVNVRMCQGRRSPSTPFAPRLHIHVQRGLAHSRNHRGVAFQALSNLATAIHHVASGRRGVPISTQVYPDEDTHQGLHVDLFLALFPKPGCGQDSVLEQGWKKGGHAWPVHVLVHRPALPSASLNIDMRLRTLIVLQQEWSFSSTGEASGPAAREQLPPMGAHCVCLPSPDVRDTEAVMVLFVPDFIKM